ncbi:hypothetical protein vseg_016504 [Gypsophila vaccaria]
MQIVFQLVIALFIFETICFSLSTAIECTKGSSTITVSKSGSGNFNTITDALNSVPSTNNQWIRIFVRPGIYEEQIQVDKSCISLEGKHRSNTIITYGAHDTTLQSITFGVNVDNFIASGITFRNSYNRPLGPSPNITQAVAFRAYGDKHAYYRCGFEGYQDTMWDELGRHYYKNCYIEGAVDFIFGNGQSVFKNCLLNVTGNGFITAQSRNSPQAPTGYVFQDCNVVGTGNVLLGRAYRAYSRVIYVNTYFDNIIAPQGWEIWLQSGHEMDTIYAEVNCRGPGSDTSKRVPWEKKLNSNEVEQYSTLAFIDTEGWIAATVLVAPYLFNDSIVA